MSDGNNEQLTGTDFLEYLQVRFQMNARQAMQRCLETGQLSHQQRNHRSNIRNAYMVEDVSVIKAGMEQQDAFGKLCLQEMIDDCKQHGVDNYGKTPAFG